MILSEAIDHANEVAADKLKLAEWYGEGKSDVSQQYKEDCMKCANEHLQLARWLTELKERREADKYYEPKMGEDCWEDDN